MQQIVISVVGLTLWIASSWAGADTFEGRGYSTLPPGGCPGHRQFAYDHWAQLPTLSEEAKCSSSPFSQEFSARVLRGGEPTFSGVQCLAAQGVRTIIDLRSDEEVNQSSERKWAQAMGIRYIHLGMSGWSNPGSQSCVRRGLNVLECNREKVTAGLELLKAILTSPTSGKVYIHCAHGADRTGLFVGLFRTELQGCSKSAARAEMADFGFSPFPSLLRVWDQGL